MKQVWIFCVLLISLSAISGCTEDAEIEPGAGILDEYFPVEIGDVRTYSIDSITYDYDGNLQRIVIDTQRIYLQERVLEMVQINGADWFRIGMFHSADPDGNYELTDYVYEQITDERLLRKEGNLTFIPLASPLVLFSEWDGTAYFDAGMVSQFVRGEVIKPYEDWEYLYLERWDEYTVGQKSYPDVIQINQRDTIALGTGDMNNVVPPEKQLFYYLANEFYAPHTGLIYKEEYHLTSICASSSAADFQAFCDSTSIFENAERGYILNKKLISLE